MKIITLNHDNIDEEHICCAIADKKCSEGYQMKKEYIKSMLDKGFKFKKLDARGKVFIEYVPADAAPYFELLVKKNNPKAVDPKFTDKAKINQCKNKYGLTVYYTNQCPFTEYYVNEELSRLAKEHGFPLKIIKVEEQEAARNNPCPFVNYSLYHNGEFVTHEILSMKKFEKLLVK